MTPSEGWLRFVLYDMRDVAFDHFETSLSYVKSNIKYFCGVLEKQPGFEAAYWGVDLDDGKIAAVSHWSSLQAIEAAGDEFARLQADAEVHGIHRVHVQNIQLFPLPPAASARAGAHAGSEPFVTDQTWLRVVSYHVDAGDERAENYVRHRIHEFLQVLETQTGFRRGYWGRDLVAGCITAITYWDSRRAIVSAEPALRKLQVQAMAEGVRPTDVRNVHLFAVNPAPHGGARLRGPDRAGRERSTV